MTAKKIVLVLGLLVLLMLAMTITASADGPGVCPDGGAWVKVDGLSGTTYTFTPPEGYTVGANCYKHATFVHFGSGPTVTADAHCAWEWRGWRLVYVCHTYELSHASFELIPLPPPEVEGCTDQAALNFNPEATLDDGSCEYAPPPEVCDDPDALNYEAEGACEYEEPEDPPVVVSVCEVTRLYDLWRYRMEDAPDWYYMGGLCWIKSSGGLAPGADLVIRGCSRQCVDDTFVWEGTTPEFVGGVFVDCQGRVFSDDPLWDVTAFDLGYSQGELPTCVNAGCP